MIRTMLLSPAVTVETECYWVTSMSPEHLLYDWLQGNCSSCPEGAGRREALIGSAG